MGTAASTPVEVGNSPKRISPPPPQPIGEPTSTMSLTDEPQTQDDTSQEALMGLRELDTHISLLDDSASASPKDHATPISTISSPISKTNEIGIHNSIENTTKDALMTKSFLSTEAIPLSTSVEGRPRKVLKTSKYVA